MYHSSIKSIFFFSFFGEVRKTKIAFEIIWPLAQGKVEQRKGLWYLLHEINVGSQYRNVRMWVSLNWIAGKLYKIPWHAATKVSSWINEYNCGAFLPTKGRSICKIANSLVINFVSVCFTNHYGCVQLVNIDYNPASKMYLIL